MDVQPTAVGGGHGGGCQGGWERRWRCGGVNYHPCNCISSSHGLDRSISACYRVARRSGSHNAVRTHAPGRGPSATLYIWGLWALDLEIQNYRQRLDGIQNLLRLRVQLSKYYSFGRIEPGRHGCFFGLENGHLRPTTIIFSPQRGLGGEGRALWGARKSSLTWGAARQKTQFFRQK